jgi:hypothetical protein
MNTLSTLIQSIRTINTTSLAVRTGSTLLFGLSLVIVYQLVCHGQAALGAYMLIGQILEKLHHHSGNGNEVAEHVVHITAHGTKLH